MKATVAAVFVFIGQAAAEWGLRGETTRRLDHGLCSKFPACAARGLTGACCPTADNVTLDCCNEDVLALDLRILLGAGSQSTGANGPNYPTAVGTYRTFYSEAVDYATGDDAGWLSGHCTVTKLGAPNELPGNASYVEFCSAVFDARETGSITYGADLYRAPDPTTPIYLTINGGTLAYKGVTGQIVRTNVPADEQATSSASEQRYYFEFA